ncbi:MAG: Phosphoglycerate mutase [Gemmatimonadetes bacterium]|nr:Phosphoglycerate mutase [Gemmatimonadota bacterium]
MTLRLYLLRHGQTAMSRANVFCGRGLDPELTAEGASMAEAFAATYKSHPWTAIYASPLTRAVATATPLATAIGLPIERRAELAEIDYGEWDGLSAEVVDRKWHDEYERWTADPAWNPPTQGETAIAIAQRMTNIVEEISDAHMDGNVLVVSHKASIRVLLCALLGVDVGRFRYRFGCPVGSVSIVAFGAHGPLAEAVADRSHLDATLRGLEGT